MFEFISKKFADIKILHEGYTADYFLNRMKTNALFPIRLLHSVHFREKKTTFYGVIFCFLVLIGQYLSRNWLLDT
jgi:hypothetical protein